MTEAAPAAAGTGIDTSDMKALHQVFRQAFSLAPRLVGGVPEGDVERAGLVGSYYFNVLRLLHGHHDGEDEIIWPRLYERCPDQASMVQRIAGQHQDVVPLIDTACQQVNQWSASASPDDGRQLLTTLSQLDKVLTDHLDQEEDKVLPLCSKFMTQAEWGELPAHGMRTFDADKPWLIMGLVREQMSPAQVAAMSAAFPPPVTEMWANFGQGAFDGFVAQLRAPLNA